MQQRVAQGETVSLLLVQFDDASIGKRGRGGGVCGGKGWVIEEQRVQRAVLQRS